MQRQEEIIFSCPLCTTGSLITIQTYAANNGGIPVWAASCDNINCVGSEEVEVMGGLDYSFPMDEWLEEFGVYYDE